MKNIFKLILISCLVLQSCESDLDINTNPNSPPSIDKSFALTAAEASIATILGGQLTNYGGFMVQYHTQSPGASQYLEIDQYNVGSDYTNRMWTEAYAGSISDLDFVISKSLEEADNSTYLIAKTLRAYIFQVLTDFYGDIPYSEVLTGIDNINPAPIKQEEIYDALIISIDEALTRYNSNPTPVPSNVIDQDALLAGKMPKWVQFANTLKLKMYLRLAYTNKANPSEVTSLILGGNLLTEDVSFGLYTDEENKKNPFVDVQIDELGDVNNIASNSLLMFYQENNDPRLTEVYRQNSAKAFVAIDQGTRGDEPSTAVARNYSRPNINPTKPVFFITAAESNFLQAEGLIRYSGGAGAKAKYDEGVKQSFLNYGFPLTTTEEIEVLNVLITGTGPYVYTPGTNIEDTVRQVIIQKWASLAYVNTIEAYFEQLRTGFPEIKGTPDYSQGNLKTSAISVLSDKTIIPNSMFYSDGEVSRNSNLTQKSSLTEKVWWDQK